MEKASVKQKVVLYQDTDFTPGALVKWLNEKFETKASGNEFSFRDVQQYTMRGFLPKQYGGYAIEVIEDSAIGIKILRLKIDEKKK